MVSSGKQEEEEEEGERGSRFGYSGGSHGGQRRKVRAFVLFVSDYVRVW